ncbi:MAG TPA: hypothetical protein VGD37_06830 [Kofleriaceae bacterium]|jgi:hypothetical protein
MLVSCNRDGTAEVSEICAVGCAASELRCNDINPSNNLAQYLDMAADELDVDLGSNATINTTDGTIVADGNPVPVRTVTMAQTSAPSVRVFVARSLTAVNVTITGSHALAIVSNGDLKIDGAFAASAQGSSSGAGGFNDGTCTGSNGEVSNGAVSGAGGGGFGLGGGRGGSAFSDNGSATGGAAGSPTGNPTLIPLRGGCDSGAFINAKGSGGGAIQLVSRTRIAVSGTVAANGSSRVGGGSGGGILLEAPVVEVSGGVVANGGAGGGGCLLPLSGEDGRLDAMPASAGIGCAGSGGVDGGNGGSGNAAARNGASINRVGTGFNNAYAGYGGGGVGRIRVNTVSGGLHVTGLFSPNPSTGSIAIR